MLKMFAQNEIFMKYFKNSSWMMAEYGLKIISAIFVSIYVARYLGPDKFGLLSYALAIVTIFMAVSRLGMDSILVRDLSKSPDKAKSYMGTSFGLMLLSAAVCLIFLSMLIYFFESDAQTKVYIFVVSISLLFQPLLIVDYGFQAQVKAKYSSIAKSIALAISSIVKIYLVWIQADLFAFAIAYAFDNFIIAFMLVCMHFAKKQVGFILTFDKNLVRPLLTGALPMVLTAGMGMLLLRLDQILIGIILGNEELGHYVAALRLYEGWIMIPQIFAMSLIPAIVSLKQKSEEMYKEKIVLFMRVVLFMNLIVALSVSIFSKQIIGFLYGEQFIESSSVLTIVIWCALFMGIGSVSFRYMVNEGLERKIVRVLLVALISNTALNLLLIPIMGIKGAALALLASLFIAYILYDFFDKEMSGLKEIKLRAIHVK